jgi:hypothetical protein
MEDEQSRPFANGDEQTYTLTVEEVARRYEAAGHPRTLRAVQKYCARGDLDCVKEETEFGQRYRITSESVARHLAQIEEVRQANGRDQSRTDASVRSLELPLEQPKNNEATVREQPRPDATDTRYVAQLENENAYLRAQNEKKDQQLERRDHQIEAMIERDMETNTLIQGLQRLLGLPPGQPRSGPTPFDDQRPRAE